MKPLLKWAGGKRWLLPILQSLWQAWNPHHEHRLVEPFAGGLAIALGLNPKAAVLNDANVHLINFYQQVKKGLTFDYPLKNNAQFYYEMRDTFNTLRREKKHRSKEAACIFYYLIRTGYNGLCRFNNSGEFNVPFGQHKSIRYKTNFLDDREILKKWQLRHGDFQKIILKDTDFLYADPPYDVEFTKYNVNDFVWEDQIRLAHWLVKHQGPVIASNQATPRIIELYKDLKFTVFTLTAPRSIACTGDRTPALEILAVKNIEKRMLKKSFLTTNH